MPDTRPRPGETGADFEEDPRYRTAMRELGIALAYWAVFTVAVTATAWLLGGGKDADELTFVLGFPAWFFWSVPVMCFAFSGVAYLLVRRFFTDIPLSADGSAGEEREEG